MNSNPADHQSQATSGRVLWAIVKKQGPRPAHRFFPGRHEWAGRRANMNTLSSGLPSLRRGWRALSLYMGVKVEAWRSGCRLTCIDMSLSGKRLGDGCFWGMPSHGALGAQVPWILVSLWRTCLLDALISQVFCIEALLAFAARGWRTISRWKP